MTTPLRSNPITGPSSLLRTSPPLCPASVLRPSRRLAAWVAESARGISPRAAHRTGRKPLDLSGSCHPSKAAAFRRNQPGSSCQRLTHKLARRGWPAPFAPQALPRFTATTKQSAPALAHRYFRPRGSATCAFSLAIAKQVLKFPYQSPD